MTSINYKNIEIRVNPHTGTFQAEVAGVGITKQSLSAMKEHIDKEQTTPFQAFNGLKQSNYSNRHLVDRQSGLVPTKVINIKIDGRAKADYKKYRFVEEDGNESLYSIFDDTAENREAIAAWNHHRQETDRIEKERKDQEHELYAKVVVRRASDNFGGVK